VILFPGRTGSSYLVSCLASHPEIACEGERLVRQDAAAQQRWIRAHYTDPRGAACRAVGFKTKLKDAWDTDALVRLLDELDVRPVTLVRRNLVKLAVSTINARRIHAATGRWNNAADAPALDPIAIEPAELERQIATCATAQDEVRRLASTLRRPALALSYEDLLADRDAVLAQVVDFLGVRMLPMRHGTGKATPDDLRAALLNHDELRRHFAGTPHASDFSDEA
jgi:LPS sulfotransferase NodH